MDCRATAPNGGSSGLPIGPDTGDMRSGVWLLLAMLLREPPNAAMLGRLREGIREPAADDPLGLAWQALHHASRAADPDGVDSEFHDLFIGLGRGELVPYASWYRAGFLMDRPLVALRGDLAELGLRRRSGNREPEDHAASLAETMALLADPDSGRNESTQARVFREHLDSWMPTFFGDLQKARSADFYRTVGRLGAAFVEFERRFLEEAAAA